MARCFLLVVALSLFALVQLGESLKCYHCIKPLGEDCDNPTKNPAYIKDCPNDPDLACLTRNITLSIGGGQIIRDCAPKSQCITPRDAFSNDTCTICTEDLCNASAGVFPSLFTIAGASIVITAIISKINF